MVKKNTYIELWRFVFCCIILNHHVGGIGTTRHLFPAGFLAVEFFFILSGFFAMKHLKRSYDKECGMMEYSLKMTIQKMGRIFPYAAIGILIAYIWKIICYEAGTGIGDKILGVRNVFYELFFLPMTGIIRLDLTEYLNPPLWYLSALMIALPIVAYLAIRYTDAFEHYIVWFLPLMLHGFLLGTYGLGDWGNPVAFTYSGVIRGFADLLLGCALYLIVDKINTVRWQDYMRLVFTMVEVLLILASVYMCTMRVDGYVYEIGVWLFVFSLAVTLSGVSYTANIDSKVFAYLGKLSLPMYCVHWPVYTIAESCFAGFSYEQKMMYVFALCIIISIISVWIVEKCLTKKRISLKVFFGRLFIKQ